MPSCKLTIFDFSRNEKSYINCNNSSNIDNLYSGDLSYVYENHYYVITALLTELTQKISSVKFYINGDLQELKSNEYYLTSNKIVFYKKLFFLLRYDIIIMTIVIETVDGKNYTFFSDPVAVICNDKKALDNVVKMIDEIESLDKTVLISSNLERSTSLTRNEAQKGENQTITAFLELCRITLQCYRQNSISFYNNTKHQIMYQSQITDYKKAALMSPSSFYWVMQNPEYIRTCNFQTPIKFNDKYILPTKVLSDQHIRNSDIYENQIILGFLDCVISKLFEINQQATLICNKTEQIRIKNKSSILPDYFIPNEYIQHSIRFKYQCASDYSNTLIKEFGAIRRQYQDILKCHPVLIKSIPLFTDTFKSLPHYHQIYMIIKKWFEFGDYSINSIGFLLSMKSVSELYEYYCLLKLINTITKMGFVFDAKSSKAFTYDQPDYRYLPPQYLKDSLLSKNTYYFKKDTCELILYYQPIIYSYKVSDNNGIDLYRSDEEHNYYVPDFILKYTFENSRRHAYAIFDAKYSTQKNSQIYELTESKTLKYIYSISEIGLYHPTLCSMWLLQGRPDRIKNSIYYRSEYAKKLHPLPSIGIQQLNPEISIQELVAFIESEFLELAELIQ